MAKLTAMMLVRNEGQRYLKQCLDSLSGFVDELVVWDDASTDNTAEICCSYSILRAMGRSANSIFWQNESALRQQLLDLTLETAPQWIMAIDADEIFEDKAKKVMHALLKGDHNWVAFPFYDFWGSTSHYRVDGLWNPKGRYMPMVFRINSRQQHYVFPQQRLHCGRLPLGAVTGKGLKVNLRLKHFGWANSEEHRKKYLRYIEADPDGKHSPLSHYHSILLSKPSLKKWLD